MNKSLAMIGSYPIAQTVCEYDVGHDERMKFTNWDRMRSKYTRTNVNINQMKESTNELKNVHVPGSKIIFVPCYKINWPYDVRKNQINFIVLRFLDLELTFYLYIYIYPVKGKGKDKEVNITNWVLNNIIL